MINYFGIVLILLSIFSCSPKKLSPGDYQLWVTSYDNGFRKKKQVEGLTFDIQYKPIEFIASVEAKGNNEVFQKEMKALQGMEYFDLTITSDNGDFIKEGSKSREDFYNKLYYFSFQFQNDIKLKEGDREYPCVLYHFEKSYDLKKERKFLLGFSKTSTKEEKTLIIDALELGTSIIKIKFEKQDQESIPQIIM